MKKVNRLLVLFTAICVLSLASFFISCAKKPSADKGYFPIDEETPQIILSDGVLEIEAGDEREVTVSLYNVEGNIVWQSTDTTVATVDGGLITAKQSGKTTVSASVGDLTATCEVTVIKSTAGPVIKTNFDEITLENGDSVTITASVYRKNKLVNVIVDWSIEGDDAASFTATEQNGGFKITANAGGKNAVVFAETELNGIKAYKSINVSSVASGEIGKAEYIAGVIASLPDEISSMTVAETLSLPELFDGYDRLTDTEKSEIDDDSKARLAAIRNSFTSAEWKYSLAEKVTLSGADNGETAGGKPAYATESKVEQGEKFGINFDYSKFKEVYFALKIEGGNAAPSLSNDSGEFILQQNKWYYFKNISCADGCVLMVADDLGGDYSIAKITRWQDKNSAPKNLADLLVLNNVSSVETLYYGVAATGLYTNSALDAVEVYAEDLPETADSSAEDWDDIFAAYKMLGYLSDGEKAEIETAVTKVNALYEKWRDFFDDEISGWGSVHIEKLFDDKGAVSSIEFGSLPVYKRSGVKADDDVIGKSGSYLDYDGAKGEFYFAVKATEAVRFKESRNYLLEANKWYTVKMLKNPEAQYGGWNIFVKPAGEENYTKLDYPFQWRLGNHAAYNGKAYINCFLVFTSEYGKSFDVYATGMFAVDPPISDPFVGMTKITDSALNVDSVLQSEKFCGGDVYKLGGLTTNSTANANVIGNSYKMDYNGEYSEYYLAIKITARARICTGSGNVVLSENNWYVVKFTKNPDADFGGWNLFIKLAYESDDKYAQVAVGDQWRLGNHKDYNGTANLNCALAIYTDGNWDLTFDVYATALYAKK